jgi:hypothetical protein
LTYAPFTLHSEDMKKNFKPTKAKIIITILLVIASFVLYAHVLSFYGETLINWCYPRIPLQPTPTPLPVSLSRTMADVPRLVNPGPVGDYGDVMCLTDDRSAQVAAQIVDISKIFSVIVYILILYTITCTIVSLLTGSRKPKTSQDKIKK